MKEHPSRVSQENLADVLASAVSVERRRIEELNAAAIDQIAGGQSPEDPPTTGTMGMFPRESDVPV